MRRGFYLLSAAFVVVSTLVIVWLEQRSGYLDDWAREYADGGSCKWRFLRVAPSDLVRRAEEARRHFYTLVQISLLSWPIGLGALGLSIAEFVNRQRRISTLLFDSAIVSSLIWLAVSKAPHAALHICA